MDLSRGIGFETAKQLYKLGGTVYLGVRSEENARRAIERIRADVTSSDGQLKWLPLDLSTISQARKSAEAFLQMEDRLDVLGKFFVFGLVVSLMQRNVYQSITRVCELPV
jgi:NAD(P)-dependent dehydrogenase (short-subunit alcohol dehydrogenase family)